MLAPTGGSHAPGKGLGESENPCLGAGPRLPPQGPASQTGWAVWGAGPRLPSQGPASQTGWAVGQPFLLSTLSSSLGPHFQRSPVSGALGFIFNYLGDWFPEQLSPGPRVLSPGGTSESHRELKKICTFAGSPPG